MKKNALITGASSGIGKELARLYAQKGFNLVIVARRINRLIELQKELQDKFHCSVETIQADLANVNSCSSIVKKLDEKKIKIDYLVNNAGFGGHGIFHEQSWEDYQNMINVNIMALTKLTHQLLPQMVERNYGRILNISSTAAFLPGPYQAVYYATKAYVSSFTQAINEELCDKNIWATAFCPTATATEFALVGNLTETSYFQRKSKDAVLVAQNAFNSIEKKKYVSVDSTFEAFGLRYVFPFLSRKRVLKLSKKYMEISK